MCTSSTLLLSPKLSIYTETNLRSPQIKFISRFDGLACGSLAAEVYAFGSIYTMAHTIFLGLDSVFILGPSGHESLRIHALRETNILEVYTALPANFIPPLTRLLALRPL